MVPLFPSFKKLELEDREAIEFFTNKFLPYSDFNFLSMYGYNTENKLAFSTLNHNLIVLFTDYLTNEPFYSFIGKNKPLNTSLKLLTDAKKRGIVPYLRLIPEIAITPEMLHTGKLEVLEDRDNFDYILLIENIAKLDKRHYNKVKQLKIFERSYPGSIVKELDLHDQITQKQILRVFEQWRQLKNISLDESKTELAAITRSIVNANYLSVYAIGIFLHNTLIGFSIADLGHDEYAEFHFAKGLSQFNGIYAALYIYLAQCLYKKQFVYMNIEQDLGIMGLRNAKEQWHPIEYLKKYTIRLKDN